MRKATTYRLHTNDKAATQTLRGGV
jgi:hypothetical protein